MLLKKAKLRLLQMHYESGVGHIGGNLSCLDSVLLLHTCIMEKHDLFVLSKGHSAGALYVSLWVAGRLTDAQLRQFHQDGTKMAGHPPPQWNSDIPFATGSLGHGFPVSCGMALARKLNNAPGRIYCLMSDGEWQEGSNWEALIFAHHQKLHNLTVLIDLNGLQGFGTTDEVASMADLIHRIQGFGVPVKGVDGHDYSALKSTLENPSGRFEILVLRTIKGKGVSFMEDKVDWHYLPMSAALYQNAVNEVRKA